MFKQIIGQSAVVRKGGVYKHCDLYEYNGQLFVKYGGGYIRLSADGKSSVDGLALDMLAYDGPLFKDRFGRLCVTAAADRVAMVALEDGSLKQLPNGGDVK